jgi:hypothetical protein
MGDQDSRPARPRRRVPQAHIAVVLILLTVNLTACS